MDGTDAPGKDVGAITIVLDSTIVSREALAKTCYWFSRDFYTEIVHSADSHFVVRLSPKDISKPLEISAIRGDFLNSALDFELRSRVEKHTSSIRELILAKAFAESGVLEDSPEGMFTDSVEEAKPDGLFKILQSHSTH